MAFDHGHALLIGVDTYHYAPKLNVRVTANDAAAVAGVLLDPGYCGYPNEQVRVLSGHAATRTNILNAIDQLSLRVRTEDTVFLFHCGHGDYGTDGSYHLLCHDTQIQGNKVVSGTGISQEELLLKFQEIRAQRLLLIFNACHSGEMSPHLEIDQGPGGKNLPAQTAEALLSSGSGRSVITACREDQSSWIGREQLTIFGQALVEGLQGKGISPRGGFISLFDLYTALYEVVTRTVDEQLGKPQEPELTILKGVGPFALALYQGAGKTDLSALDVEVDPPKGAAVRQVEPGRSAQQSQQILDQTGGINFGLGSRAKITGDVMGGNRIDTGGGAYVGRNVIVKDGNFIGRDQIGNSTAPSQAPSVDDFLGLLEQLHTEFNRTRLESKVRAMISSEIAAVREEAQEVQPSLAIVEAKLTGLQNLAAKTLGADPLSARIDQTIRQAIRAAQTLFR